MQEATPPFVSRTLQKGTARAKGPTEQSGNRSGAWVFSTPPWPVAGQGGWKRLPRLRAPCHSSTLHSSQIIPPSAAGFFLLHFWVAVSSFYCQEAGTKDQGPQTHLKWEGSIPSGSSLTRALSSFLANSREPETAGGRTREQSRQPAASVHHHQGGEAERTAHLTEISRRFWNQIQCPTLESGQATGAGSLVLARHTTGLFFF